MEEQMAMNEAIAKAVVEATWVHTTDIIRITKPEIRRPKRTQARQSSTQAATIQLGSNRQIHGMESI